MAKITSIHTSGNPVGAILACGNSGALPRTLLCNGAAVSRTTYAALYAAIGTSFGSGDGSTTFNVPDARGIFLRGSGTNGTMTNAIGSFFSTTLGFKQNDQIQGHVHPRGKAITANLQPGGSGKPDIDPNQVGYTGNPESDGSNGTPRTGVETRPANLGINYCIAY